MYVCERTLHPCLPPTTFAGVEGGSPLLSTLPNTPINVLPQHIKGMPDQPLELLRRLVALMKVLVGQLRELCSHVSGSLIFWSDRAI